MNNPYDAVMTAVERGAFSEARLLYLNIELGPYEEKEKDWGEEIYGRCVHCNAWYDECECPGGLSR